MRPLVNAASKGRLCRPESCVFKTIDGGLNWVDVSGNITSHAVNELKIPPAGPDVVLAATTQGVFKTTDGGQSFHPLGSNPRLGKHSLVIDPHIANRLYLGVGRSPDGGGVFRSDDGGQSWIDVTTSGQPKHVTDLVLETRSPETLYAITEGGVYRRDLGAVPVTLVSFTVE